MRVFTLPLLSLFVSAPVLAAVPFDAGTSIASLVGGYGAAAGDLDGDGDIDLVVTDGATDSVVILDNDGAWTQTVVSATVLGADRIALSDVDSDGALDILVTATGDNDIRVFLNDGAGGFGASTQVASAVGPVAFVVGDVENDGDDDVVASRAGDVDAWTNAGGSGWNAPSAITTGTSPTDVALGDLNGDGFLDVVVADNGAGSVTWHDSDAGFAGSDIGLALDSVYSAVTLDVDRDGMTDVVTGHRNPTAGSTSITVFRNETDQAAGWVAVDGSTSLLVDAAHMVVGDLDNDGWDDVVIASEGGDIHLLRNAGGTFETQLVGVATGSRTPVLADTDNDGDLDIIVVGATDVVLFDNLGIHPEWSIASSGLTMPLADPWRMDPADVDGDGDLDVVFGLNSVSQGIEIGWLENTDGTGTALVPNTIRAVSLTGSPDAVRAVEAVDLDRDGDMDVIATLRTPDEVLFMEQGPAGTWTEWTIASGINNAYGVVTGDMEGDGDVDVVAGRSAGAGDLFWLENDGTPANTSWVQNPIDTVGNEYKGLRIADVDGDGDPDVLGHSVVTDEIAWWANDGAGGGWSKTVIESLVPGAGFALGDIDLDGDLDLVRAAPSAAVNGSLAWLENTAGDGSTWTVATLDDGFLGNGVDLADIDEDGDLDLLVEQNRALQIRLWDGSTFAPPTTVGTGSITFVGESAFADLNGDGATDVLYTDRQSTNARFGWHAGSESRSQTTVTSVAPTDIPELLSDAVLKIETDNLGLPGDTEILSGLVELNIEDGQGTPLTESELGDLLTAIHLYGDDGDETWTAADPLLGTITTYADLEILAGPLAAAAPGGSSTLWVVPEIAPTGVLGATTVFFEVTDIEHYVGAQQYPMSGPFTASGATFGIVDGDTDGDGTSDDGDCGPTDSTIYPGAPESCDAIDSDCDNSLVDDFPNYDSDTEPDCIDLDDDNDGDPDATDCDDFDATISATGTELCDAIDSNCNGSIVDTFTDTDGDLTPDCVDLDDDGDGLTDVWEDANGYDPLVADATDDPDLDGRDGTQEFADGTNPNVYDGPNEPTLSLPLDGARVPTETPSLVALAATSLLGEDLLYTFEVFTDGALDTLLTSVSGVAEPTSGEVTWVVDVPLAEDAGHWWRVAASDPYVQGPWSDVFLVTADVIGDAPTRPEPVFPLTGEVMFASEEQLVWTESTSPEGLDIEYLVEFVDAQGALLTSERFAQEAVDGTITWQIDVALEANRPYSWQAQAIDPVGRTSGPSSLQNFGYETINQAPDAPVFVSPTAEEQLVDLVPDVQVTVPDDPENGAVWLRLEIDSVKTFDGPDLLVLELEAGEGGTFDLAGADFSFREHANWSLRATSFDIMGRSCVAPAVINVFARGENDAPNVPELLGPADNVGVEPRPTFQLRASSDPEGDAISYEIRLSRDEAGEDVVNSVTVSTTDWTAEEDLSEGVY